MRNVARRNGPERAPTGEPGGPTRKPGSTLTGKGLVGALMVVGLLAAIVTPVAGLWNAFGDTSVRLSTPLIDGVRVSCVDGFDYRVAYKPNDSFGAVAGDPTNLPAGGGFPSSFRVYRFDDVRNPDGSVLPGLTPDFTTTPARWVDGGGVPVPDLGTFTVQINYVDTFFDSDPGDPQSIVVAALTEGSYTYPVAQPVGTRIEINGATMESGRFIEVVEDCDPEPPLLSPEINMRPFARDYGIVWIKWWATTVAVINDGSFDPATVGDLRLGPDQAEPFRVRLIDIDHDGDKDVVARFMVAKTGIACGDTEATLTGTIDGQPFASSTDIVVWGCHR